MKLGEDYRMPVTPCPRCGLPFDAALRAEMPGSVEAPPRVGDISVCIRCGFLSVFVEGGKLRPMTVEDVQAMSEDEARHLHAALSALVQYRRLEN